VTDVTNLSEYQPVYYKKSEVMSAVNDALNAEFERLKAEISKISDESNILTATEWIDKWETSVGLESNTNLTLEQRRSRVLSRYRQIGATTKERVKAIVEAYTRGEVVIVEDSANYKIYIKFTNIIGKPDNMDGIIIQLKLIMPAHLAVEFEYKYRTWRDVLNSGKTWRDLLESGYTWNDILNKEAL
jgi:uncharacterized protein YmfQ (DUF2313 family)